ncbi:hypothetical protein ABZS66_11960 [Dactylosporangium sp. NPDC005572]|uniref:phthiocerol/phthiodiolone dimycocerosyl transferase family protein n=1 Tax=Dactylosporangium sp. NPDC005572 TaxID=3156889 RepID=UPI0033BF119D
MSTEVRRPLSPMERWYWICDQISPLNVIARVRVAGAIPPEDLARAAGWLVREHPLLRVAVADEPDGTAPRFVAAPQTDLGIRTVRPESPDPARWEREVDEVELATSLDWRNGPLARIVDVAHPDGTHDLILTVSHVIADGTTALRLLQRLVELAADPPPAPPPSREALPSPEALLPRRVNGLPRPVHMALAVLADGVLMGVARPRRLAPLTPVPPDRRQTRLVSRTLDPHRLRELVARCRQEGVTVHSALTAAIAFAVAGVAIGRAGTVCVGAPVDFRAELVPPVGPHDAGAYVATVPSYVRVAPTGPQDAAALWTAARGVSRDLRRRRRFRQHLALVSMLRRMSPPSVLRSASAVRMIDRIGPGNVCLSNLGRFDFPDRIGAWDLTGAQFVAGISISGSLVASVNTSHAALHCNFTYIDGVVTRERAGRIADEAVRTLLSSLDTGASGVSVGTGMRG